MPSTVVPLLSMFRLPCILFSAFLLLGGTASAQNPVSTNPIPAQSAQAGDAAVELGLDGYFTIENVSGRISRFYTVFGSFDVEMLSDFAPNHVTNFMGYVAREDYDNTVIHRMAPFSTDEVAIVQGGGYVSGETLEELPIVGNVALEYDYPNFRGTLAAARSTNPNSAAAGWYINTIDNSVTLGPANDGFGYSVFGRVMGEGMTVVDVIAQVERFVVAGFSDFPLRDYIAGSDITEDNFVLVNRVREVEMYPETNETEAALMFTVTSSNPAVATATMDGSTLRLDPVNVGTATITVRAADISGQVVTQEVEFSVGGIALSSQPQSQDVDVGSTADLSVAVADGATVTHQWYRQRAGESAATALDGANAATLSIANAQAGDMGFYWAQVSQGELTINSDIAILTLSGGSSRLANLSTRGQIAAGGSLTSGFVVEGTGSKELVVRAVGPELLNFGVQSAMTDPRMEIIPASGSTSVLTNDDWGDSANAADLMTKSAELGAFPLGAGSKDAAVLTSLPFPTAAGSQGYTVRIQSTDAGASGIALAEIYDPDAIGAPISLVNVSALGFSGTDENVLSPGFVIDGSGAKTMLIRVVGPSLTDFEVTGVMADPRLSLIPAGQSNVIAQNDNWGGTTELKEAFATTGAFQLSSDGSLDAAVLVRLPPGAYTVKPEGFAEGTGTILVEVYAVEE